MVRPEDSSSWRAFENVPDEFLEDIVIVRRERTGEDSYGKAIFTTTEKTVRGRFQFVDAANRIPEQGGVRSTEQARIFLPIKVDNGIIFEDPFDYGTPSVPVPPDPTKWEEPFGTNLVNGEYLDIVGVVVTKENQGYTYGEIEIDLYGTTTGAPFYIQFKLIDAELYPSAAQTILFRIEPDGSGDEHIILGSSGPSASQNVDEYTGSPLKDRYAIKLAWSEAGIKVWIDGEFWNELKEEDDPGSIMNIPARIEVRREAYVGNVNRCYSVKVTQILPVVVLATDHIKARDKEWAIMQEPYHTHLQQELFVQEVIP